MIEEDRLLPEHCKQKLKERIAIARNSKFTKTIEKTRFSASQIESEPHKKTLFFIKELLNLVMNPMVSMTEKTKTVGGDKGNMTSNKVSRPARGGGGGNPCIKTGYSVFTPYRKTYRGTQVSDSILHLNI